MEKRLEGKVALVTGGGSGIGRASALLFAREGATVMVSDWRDEGGLETVELIEAAGGVAKFVRADVSKAEEVGAMVRATVEAFGRIGCALNNAGIGTAPAPIHAYVDDQWDKILAINLTGVYYCMKEELRVMLGAKKGAIVNLASVAGLQGAPGLSAYVASKHGVVGLTKTAAMEYGSKGIRVNAVCPAFIHTPLVDRLLETVPGAEAQIVARQGRIGEPNEVAEAVVWLCSDAASFCNGHSLTLDNGRS